MEKPAAVKKSGVFQLLAESLYSSVSRAVPPPPKAMPGFELPPPRLPSMEKKAVPWFDRLAWNAFSDPDVFVKMCSAD